MARYNKGTVYTNENCIACNKCVTHCPIFGANISVGNAENRKILVDEKKCTNCGACISACSHGARNYKDDLEEVYRLVQAGTKVSVLVDSAFLMFYGEKAYQVLGYLSNYGIEHFYDTSFGAEISIWAHSKYLKDNADKSEAERAFIINSCPSVAEAIELYHPNLINKIIPVHSPVACMVIYARDYMKDTNEMVYLGPCVAVRKEMEELGERYNVKYAVSSDNLMKTLKDKNIEQYERIPDVTPTGIGKLISYPGVFLEGMSLFFSISSKLDLYTNIGEETFEKLEMLSMPGYEVMQPLVAEVAACADGCLKGPGIEKEAYDPVEIYTRYAKARNSEYDVNDKLSERDQIWEAVNRINIEINKLKYEDFLRSFTDRYFQPFRIPESAYDEIYDSMLKNTEQKRHIDCGSCGYSTCRELASAIAYGYSRKENCIHYMNDMVTQRYLYNPTTGLYTSEAFIAKGSMLLAKNPDKKYFVCGGNVNKLAIVNNIYGYQKGDDVLAAIAKKLKSLMSGDSLCSYFGGGNFTIMMEYTLENVDTITGVEYFDMSELGIEQPVTMRFGIYIIEDRKVGLSAMTNFSFMAGRSQSSVARNTYTYFSNEFKTYISNEIEILTKIQRALVNDEFSVSIRPKFELVGRALIGGEARAHWIDKEGRTYHHDEYVAIAERNGIVQDIDAKIWRKTFDMIRRWLDQGLEPPKIDVLMSMKSVEDERTIETITRLRDEFKVSNHYVRFCVSERSLGYDPVILARRLRFIKNVGYQVAISDFGKGHASLDSLASGSVDVLRINMDNFNTEEDEDDRAGIILSAIARMTQDIGISAEADNVRTEAQAGFIKSIGLSAGQGPLFSEDLKEHEFMELMKNTEKRERVEKKISTGKIDIGRFYDSSSYESIMFDNFSGPAAIAEYDESEGSVIIARVNNSAINIFSAEPISVKEFQDMFTSYIEGRGKSHLTDISEFIALDHDLAFTFSTNERITHKEKWVRAVVKELSRIDDRHILYIQFEDVTGNNLVEDTLHLSNTQMSHFMDKEGCGNCLIHAWKSSNELLERMRMSVIKVNSIMCKILGYSENEVDGWSENEIGRIIHPMERREFLDEFEDAIRECDKVHEMKHKIQNKSGYFRDVKMVVTSMKLEDGSFMTFLNMTES